MEFMPVRSLRDTPKEVWNQLAQDGEIVITNNGKPAALMIDLVGKDVFSIVMAIRQSMFPGQLQTTCSLPSDTSNAWLKFIEEVQSADEVIPSTYDCVLNEQVDFLGK